MAYHHVHRKHRLAKANCLTGQNWLSQTLQARAKHWHASIAENFADITNRCIPTEEQSQFPYLISLYNRSVSWFAHRAH